MRYARTGLAFVLIAIGSMLCGPALAQQEVAPVKRPVQVPVCDGGGELEIQVHPSLITTLEVPLPTPRTYAADSERFIYWVDNHLVRIRPADTAKPGDVSSAEIEVGTEWVSFKLRVVDDPDLVELRWQLVVNPALCARVLPPTSWQVTMSKYLERARYHVLTVAARARMHREQQSYGIEGARSAWDEDDWSLENLVPRDVVTFGDALAVDILGARWLGLQLGLQVKVANRTQRPYVVGAPQISIDGQPISELPDVRWSPGEFALDDSRIVIPIGEAARLKLLVPQQALVGRNITPLQVSFVGDDDKSSGARVDGWDMFPIGPDEYDDWQHEREQRRRKREAQGRVSVFASLTAGILWLANPFDETDVDAALVRGFGARARYEFNQYLAFEGDLALGWSKEARFDDVMQGELTRTGTLGRASVGIALQLGYETIPVFRGGVGLQGVHHKAAFVATPGEGPDLDFELDAVWYFGAGVDRRITEEFRVGAEVTFFRRVGLGTNVLQAGIHAVYSWKP